MPYEQEKPYHASGPSHMARSKPYLPIHLSLSLLPSSSSHKYTTLELIKRGPYSHGSAIYVGHSAKETTKGTKKSITLIGTID